MPAVPEFASAGVTFNGQVLKICWNGSISLRGERACAAPY